MKSLYIVSILAGLICTSCLNIEEEPIILVRPNAVISAHIKNERIYATAQINVNPDVLVAGNISSSFDYSGELAIYNTNSGNIIDVSDFSGGGLSQVYTVAADTAEHETLVVIASGTINAYANTGDDNDSSNDKLISSGDFYEELVIYLPDYITSAGE